MAHGTPFHFDFTKNITATKKSLEADALARINPSDMTDRYLSAAIIKLLATDFVNTDAYLHGIIDADGNVLRSRSSLTTAEERRAFTRLHVLVFNLKRALMRGFSPHRVGQIATTAFLLREETSDQVYQTVMRKLCVSPNMLGESSTKSYCLTANRVLLEELDIPLVVCSQTPVFVVAGIPVFLGESDDGDVFAFTPNEVLVEDGEGAIANTTANVDMTAPTKAPVIKREKFANIEVFEVAPDDFDRSRFGRKRRSRWSKHIASADHASAIKRYVWRNPDKAVIVKHQNTGEMSFLHHGRRR